MIKLLILGGTRFIGRRLVEKLENNSEYELTLFNRGKTNHSLFPNCRKIIGDRKNNEDLDQLFSESWDFVIDLSCYYPKSIKTIVNKINRNLTKYIFISTCSVYEIDGFDKMLKNENAPVLQCNKIEEKNTSLDTYGKRKAACERYLTNSKLPYIIFRPSLVYGPYDYSDRLYYWIHATQSNHAFILPENGERIFSITYVDDLVNCIIQSIENSICNKIYNCISHPIMSILEIIKTSSKILKQKIKVISMDAVFLKHEKILEWFDLPLWLNTNNFTFSNDALQNEFDFTPMDFVLTIEKTIHYYLKRGFPTPCCGIDRRQQNILINKFKTNEKLLRN